MSNDITDKKLEALEHAAKTLEKDVPPGRDLWPDIEARIQSEPRETKEQKGQGSYLMRIAAVVTLMVASSLLTWVVTSNQQPPSEGVLDQIAQFGEGYVLGPNYIQARAELTVPWEQRMATLSPETRKIVEENLNEIQMALNEINEALVKDPSSVLLQQLLLTTYQRELEMFNNVYRITESLSEGAEI